MEYNSSQNYTLTAEASGKRFVFTTTFSKSPKQCRIFTHRRRNHSPPSGPKVQHSPPPHSQIKTPFLSSRGFLGSAWPQYLYVCFQSSPHPFGKVNDQGICGIAILQESEGNNSDIGKRCECLCLKNNCDNWEKDSSFHKVLFSIYPLSTLRDDPVQPARSNQNHNRTRKTWEN